MALLGHIGDTSDVMFICWTHRQAGVVERLLGIKLQQPDDNENVLL